MLEILDEAGTTPSSSPRPYIHPIRTLGGVEVTATRPADHDWHMGLGSAVPDVDGTSFWGGGTSIRDRGYGVLDDHGSMTTESIDHVGAGRGDDSGDDSSPADGLDETIAWKDRAGRLVLREKRSLRWTKIDVSPAAGWELVYGRTNAGHGGFFWRLPPCSNALITSSDPAHEGEDGVHGRIIPWILWSARFEARPRATGVATLLFVPDDSTSARDPWIVRQTAYPGIGSAVAWDQRLEIADGQTLSRGFRIGIIDGNLDRGRTVHVAEMLQARVRSG